MNGFIVSFNGFDENKTVSKKSLNTGDVKSGDLQDQLQ